MTVEGNSGRLGKIWRIREDYRIRENLCRRTEKAGERDSKKTREEL